MKKPGKARRSPETGWPEDDARAACWAALAMILWIPMLTGRLSMPTAFAPVSWHAHAFLFG